MREREQDGRPPSGPGLPGFAPEPATQSPPVRGLVPDADPELIYEALRFFFWAAGEGICPCAGQDAAEPEECFWQYGLRTGDEDWETVAERYRAAQGMAVPSGSETRSGSTEGNSPVGEADAPTSLGKGIK